MCTDRDLPPCAEPLTEQAHTQLRESCEPFLLRRLRSFGLQGADADDVIQQTWMELIQRSPPLQKKDLGDPARLRAWLLRVLFSKVMNLLRDRTRRRACSLNDVVGTAQEPCSSGQEAAGQVERQEECDRMWKVLRSLVKGNLNCSLLLRRYLDGQTTAKIAAATNLTKNQVSERLRYSLDKVRKKLGGEARPRRGRKG